MKRIGLGLAFVTLSLSGACAAEVPGHVLQPVWTRRPSAEDMARLFPAAAQADKGLVNLMCAVDGEGRLANCQVVKEAPTDEGFGEASLRLAKLFEMRMNDATGAAVEGRRLRLPIAWYRPESR